MQKVADTVGVSVSTVSRILNSPTFAKKETRDSVLAAATKLGYQSRGRRASSYDEPESARDRTVGQKQIVLFAPEQKFGGVNSPDWIFRDVIPTLHRVLREKGLHLLLASYCDNDDPDLSNVRSGQTRGVLWMSGGLGQNEALLSRIARHVPVVVINDDSIWPPQASVIANNRMVMLKAVEHLAGLGHRRIGYFDSLSIEGRQSIHTRERIAELQQAIEYFGLEAASDRIIMERFGINGHPQAVKRAMDRIAEMKSPPSALIAPLCYALQFLKELRERGLSIPRDLSLMAIDNAAVAEMVEPALTVVDCNFSECAEAAVELLLEQADRTHRSAKTVLIEPRLIIRGSTAGPADAPKQ